MRLRSVSLMVLILNLLAVASGCRSGVLGGEAGLLGMWLRDDCLKRDGFLSEKSTAQFDWAGEKIRLTNKVGTLNLRTNSGSQLVVTTEKHVRGLPLKKVALEVSQKPGEVYLEARTPWAITCKRAWLLDISLTLPESAQLEGSLLWGRIDLTGPVIGKIRLRVDRGEIRVAVPAEASLRIKAEIGTRGWIEYTQELALAAALLPCGHKCLEAVLGRGQGYLQVEVDDGIITLTTERPE